MFDAISCASSHAPQSSPNIPGISPFITIFCFPYCFKPQNPICKLFTIFPRVGRLSKFLGLEAYRPGGSKWDRGSPVGSGRLEYNDKVTSYKNEIARQTLNIYVLQWNPTASLARGLCSEKLRHLAGTM